MIDKMQLVESREVVLTMGDIMDLIAPLLDKSGPTTLTELCPEVISLIPCESCGEEDDEEDAEEEGEDDEEAYEAEVAALSEMAMPVEPPKATRRRQIIMDRKKVTEAQKREAKARAIPVMRVMWKIVQQDREDIL